MDRGEGDGVAIMCRNHRWFVEASIACSKLGAHAIYLNTSFAGPQVTEVMGREATLATPYEPDSRLALVCSDDVGGIRRLPPEIHFAVIYTAAPLTDDTGKPCVEYYADGSATPATIVLQDEAKRTMNVEIFRTTGMAQVATEAGRIFSGVAIGIGQRVGTRTPKNAGVRIECIALVDPLQILLIELFG